MASIITISRQGSRLVVSPDPLTIPANSSVVFRNEDPQSAHQPTLRGQAAGFWFTHPIAAFVSGRPADTSDEVFFSAAATVSYVCGLHANEMSGTIIVQ